MAIELYNDGKPFCLMLNGPIGAMDHFWARRVRAMDVNMLLPRQGCWPKGKEVSAAFLDWIENLNCGIDLFTQDHYQLPH
jgi:flavorubredoxin